LGLHQRAESFGGNLESVEVVAGEAVKPSPERGREAHFAVSGKFSAVPWAYADVLLASRGSEIAGINGHWRMVMVQG
jgi:hypothetical protein